jgi:hypothetical protein
MDDAVLRGTELFDRGAFFEAHEAWEDRWRVLPDGDERIALQGLIQIAAGLHKLFAAAAPEPAARLLAKGLAKLDGKSLAGLDLPAFCAKIARCAARIPDLDRASIPRLGPA